MVLRYSENIPDDFFHEMSYMLIVMYSTNVFQIVPSILGHTKNDEIW
jgi:hypothetical protein